MPNDCSQCFSMTDDHKIDQLLWVRLISLLSIYFFHATHANIVKH